jgi:hypothetical protein
VPAIREVIGDACPFLESYFQGTRGNIDIEMKLDQLRGGLCDLETECLPHIEFKSNTRK